MNVLINAIYGRENFYALVPSEKLLDYNLDDIDNRSNHNENQNIRDSIAWIFDRLSLEPFNEKEESDLEESEFSSLRDLYQYLTPTPPFTVDKIITIHCY